MAATRSEISEWFDRGRAFNKTHMIVVCDTFDHEDYPVFVETNENARTVYEIYNGKQMQRVMEVYNLSLDKETQMQDSRAFNF